MIKLSILNEMLKHVKKSVDSDDYMLTQNIFFIDGRWFWFAFGYKVMLSDSIENEYMAKMLDGKVLKLHEDIKKSLSRMRFTRSVVESYEDTREGIERDIDKIKEIFSYVTESERVPCELAYFNEFTLADAGRFFPFLRYDNFYGDRVKLYFLKDRAVFKNYDKYIILSKW